MVIIVDVTIVYVMMMMRECYDDCSFCFYFKFISDMLYDAYGIPLSRALTLLSKIEDGEELL